jgi:hypothetical protein
MEILKFYSWAPNPRYAMWIRQMREELSRVSVIVRQHGDPAAKGDQGWLYGQGLKAHAQVA